MRLALVLPLLLAVAPVRAQQGDAERERAHRAEIEALRREFEAKLDALRRQVGGAPETRRPQGTDPELDALRADAEAEARRADAQHGEQEPTTLERLANALNPRITVFGDFVYRGARGEIRNEDGEDVGDRFSLRETEIDFRADIDPSAKGVATFAIEEEAPGEYHFVAEEVYASFETLPWNLRAKAGRFRTSIGRINRLHTHDLPQTTRPLAIQEFLGGEGDIQNGAGVEWLAPGLESPAITLTYQLVNGENDAVLSGAASDHLAHVGRAAAFFDLDDGSFVEVGTSALVGRAEEDAGTDTLLLGADVTNRWRFDDTSSLVLGAEGFHLQRELTAETIHSSGAYGMALYQWARDWYVGARGDWTEFADDDAGDATAVSGWASYNTSEFLRIRVGAEYLDDPRNPELDWTFYVQLTTVIGAHPPHPYWVNW